MSFRLWSDEIEAMRAEGRHVVDTVGAVMPRAAVTPAMSRDERIAAQRATHVVPPEFTVPEAVDRELAACRAASSHRMHPARSISISMAAGWLRGHR